MKSPDSRWLVILLVACAVTTTLMVTVREIRHWGSPDSSASSATAEIAAAEPIRNWDEALRIGIRTGPEDAPVQLLEFADFQCPYCAQFENVIRRVRAKHGSNIATVFVHVPLQQHEHASFAAVLAECANHVGQFEEMRVALFDSQGALGIVDSHFFAERAGIRDLRQFQSCVDDEQILDRVRASRDLAEQIGVRGTPTIAVNGVMLHRPPSFQELDNMVFAILGGSDTEAIGDLVLIHENYN